MLRTLFFSLEYFNGKLYNLLCVITLTIMLRMRYFINALWRFIDVCQEFKFKFRNNNNREMFGKEKQKHYFECWEIFLKIFKGVKVQESSNFDLIFEAQPYFWLICLNQGCQTQKLLKGHKKSLPGETLPMRATKVGERVLLPNQLFFYGFL